MDLALIDAGETERTGNVHVGRFAFFAPGLCLPKLNSNKVKILPLFQLFVALCALSHLTIPPYY
jgi:hypothetical protein